MRDDQLDLLLAFADDQQPILADGLPCDTLNGAPRPKKTPLRDDAVYRCDVPYDRNDLARSRWGVVAPEGVDGDRLLEVVAPLLRFREQEQEAPCMVFRTPAGMDARMCVEWKNDVYSSEEIAEDDRPQYVMVLGDVEQVPLPLQVSLAQRAYAGRVHFADSEGRVDFDAYTRYVEKVIRHARQPSSEAQSEVIVYVAEDGTQAMRHEAAEVLELGLEGIKKAREKGRWKIADLREIRGTNSDEFFASASSSRPAVLHSVTHGLGAPKTGWTSESERRAKLGALVLGRGDVFDAQRIATQPFLPGGVWLMQSSFGAGTAATSEYRAWLTALANQDAYRAQAEAVLASLPSDTQRPFVAALPQAALANSQGPLAVIGHVDLAWSYSVRNPPGGAMGGSYMFRWMRCLAAIAHGERVGRAFEALINAYQNINFELMTMYEMEAEAKSAGREMPPAENRGSVWMGRNDLRGYVLLGDPAVKLPLSSAR